LEKEQILKIYNVSDRNLQPGSLIWSKMSIRPLREK